MALPHRVATEGDFVVCQDHGHGHHAAARPAAPGVTRRGLLRGSAGLLAGVAVLGGELAEPSPATAAVASDGLVSKSMAMHVHSSFSEGTGSMEAQLLQAQNNAVDVLWWTDHDYRMEALRYRRTVHFSSLTGETTTEGGKPWQWQLRTVGSLTSDSTGGIAPTGSPHDPVAGSSLMVTAQATSGTASLGYVANTASAGFNERTNLFGQVLTIDVLPGSVGLDGYLEVRLATSYHPAQGGRPAGTYVLSYRVGGPGAPGTRQVDGLTGIVTLAATPGQWVSLTLTPSDDFAACWPDLDERDNTLSGITLGAVSLGGRAAGNFDYLRLARPYSSGDVPLQTQGAISAGYAGAFPGVAQRQGLEMSLFDPHLNWFGGDISLPDYTGVTAKTYAAFMQQQVGRVHAAGGLASYNHPFGANGGALLSTSAQDAKLSSLAASLLGNDVLGVDIIEVGYTSRQGCDLAHHVGLWDVLSRNGRFLTGNGVNDDHSATNWYGSGNNWVTSVWAPGDREADLLAALRAGRAWTNSLRFQVKLDLLADGSCPMGSVSVSQVRSRTLAVYAAGLPNGCYVDVIRGGVDYAGAADPRPDTVVVGSFAKAAFGATGRVGTVVDTSSSCFVRLQVRLSTGKVVAVSNPVWLLQQAPGGGVPAARAA